MEATATTHKIVAAPWQLQAAQQGRLGAVIVPLEKQPILYPETKYVYAHWFWEGDTWREKDKFNQYAKIACLIGDRLYLAEPWCKAPWGNDEGKITSDIYFTESTVPEAEHVGWQPAETMPPEAAQYWYEVTGVRVVQCKVLQFADLAKTGIFYTCPGINYPHDEMRAVWDAAHPDYTWAADRWVVVMEVKDAEKSA